ncbi:Fc.00g026350.m01.CDS01 [Cosmosporella sp. VM-42]
MYKLLVIFALAAPTILVEAALPGLLSRDGPSGFCRARLSKRDIYKGDKNGNTKIELNQHRINWGTTPPWDALDHLHKKCDRIGCNSPVKVPTQIVSGDDIHDATITISVDTTSQGKDMMNNMIEMAKAVSAGHGKKQTYKVKKKHYHPDKTGCCPPVGCCLCDSGDPKEADQYRQTNRVSIVVADNENDLHGSLEVQMKVSINVDADDQMCEDLTTIGSACAGAVSGIAGGIFDMISLAC